MGCLDPNTCDLVTSGPVCEQPGNFVISSGGPTPEDLQNCCCSRGIQSQACAKVHCESVPEVGWSKTCKGLYGKDLKHCCMSFDVLRRGKPAPGYTDTERYPDVCRKVNDDFQPDLPELEPVGPGQRRKYCTDWDSGAWDETSQKYKDCKLWCTADKSPYYKSSEWYAFQFRCDHGPDVPLPEQDQDGALPPSSGDGREASASSHLKPSRSKRAHLKWRAPKHHDAVSGQFSFE